MNKMRRCIVGMFLCFFCIGGLNACGYVWRGQEGRLSEESVLGDGTKTLRAKAVEQTTLFEWLPYYVRSQLRDIITQRSLATWVDSGNADFNITVRIHSFKIRAYGEYESGTDLYQGDLVMELLVYNGSSNTVAWQSGSIVYTDTFAHRNEETVIQEMLTTSLQRGIDRMQQRF